ncbi:hypothetical protein FRC02_011880 [Tulasnella sp. 418]|nr:hypothetical protein FRC02_011880 [Tulasnella sp. 418]
MLKILPQTPTTSLPPLKKLDQYIASQLSQSIDLLRALYLPEVRGTSTSIRTNSPTIIDSGYASEASDDELEDIKKEGKVEEAWIALRADDFERTFSIKWLTGFVARGEEWSESGAEEGEDTYDDRTKVIEDAVALLAACAGTSASGPIVRTLEFQRRPVRRTREDPVVIHLRDASLINGDYTSVGLQTWGASCLLAGDLVMNPSKFSLLPWCDGSADRRLRVLELGAGTGLLSLTLGKMLHDADIVATDFHDGVLANLRSNVVSNFPPHLSSGEIPPEIHRLDWEYIHTLALDNPFTDTMLSQLAPPFNARFDVILGADIIYETAHAQWIKSCLKVFLKYPTDAKRFFFHLMIPLRATHEKESATVTSVFPHASDIIKTRYNGPNKPPLHDLPFWTSSTSSLAALLVHIHAALI